MSEEETRRSDELKNYFAALPAFRGIYHDNNYSYDSLVTKTVSNPYISSSEPAKNVEAIKHILYDISY